MFVREALRIVKCLTDMIYFQKGLTVSELMRRKV